MVNKEKKGKKHLLTVNSVNYVNSKRYHVQKIGHVTDSKSVVNKVNKVNGKQGVLDGFYLIDDLKYSIFGIDETSIKWKTNEERIKAYIIKNNNYVKKNDILKDLNISNGTFKVTISRINKNINTFLCSEKGNNTYYSLDENIFDMFIDRFIFECEKLHKILKRKKDNSGDVNRIIDCYMCYLDLMMNEGLFDPDELYKKEYYNFNLDRFSTFNPDLYEELIEDPESHIKAIQLAFSKIDKRIKINIRFVNFDGNNYLKIFNKRTKDLNKLCKIRCAIENRTETSEVRIKSIKFECPSCGNVLTMQQERNNKNEPKRCGCGRKGNFIVLKKNKIDVIKLKIKELVQDVSHKHQSKTSNAELLSGLCDLDISKKLYLGAKVELIGYFDTFEKEKKDVREYYIFIVNNIKFLDDDYNENLISEQEKEKFQSIKDFDELLEDFRESLFYRIKGVGVEIKAFQQSVLLQQVRSSKFSNDDIDFSHISLISDSGMGKSEMIKAIEKIEPRTELVTGNDMTDAGLKGTIKKDEFTGEWCMMPGAFIRCNEGRVIIDECDKMLPETQGGLLATMTSGKVVITKASGGEGLASTNTIWFGNPNNQKFVEEKQTNKQVNFTDTMYKRFDLLFCARDSYNEEKEIKIIEAISKRFRDDDEQLELQKYDHVFIAKYLHFVRTSYNPSIDGEAYNIFSKKVLILKKNGVNLSNRVYGTILKMASWFTKFRQSNKISKEDVEKALRLHAISMKSQEVDLI